MRLKVDVDTVTTSSPRSSLLPSTFHLLTLILISAFNTIPHAASRPTASGATRGGDAGVRVHGNASSRYRDPETQLVTQKTRETVSITLDPAGNPSPITATHPLVGDVAKASAGGERHVAMRASNVSSLASGGYGSDNMARMEESISRIESALERLEDRIVRKKKAEDKGTGTISGTELLTDRLPDRDDRPRDPLSNKWYTEKGMNSSSTTNGLQHQFQNASIKQIGRGYSEVGGEEDDSQSSSEDEPDADLSTSATTRTVWRWNIQNATNSSEQFQAIDVELESLRSGVPLGKVCILLNGTVLRDMEEVDCRDQSGLHYKYLPSRLLRRNKTMSNSTTDETPTYTGVSELRQEEEDGGFDPGPISELGATAKWEDAQWELYQNGEMGNDPIWNNSLREIEMELKTGRNSTHVQIVQGLSNSSNTTHYGLLESSSSNVSGHFLQRDDPSSSASQVGNLDLLQEAGSLPKVQNGSSNSKDAKPGNSYVKAKAHGGDIKGQFAFLESANLVQSHIEHPSMTRHSYARSDTKQTGTKGFDSTLTNVVLSRKPWSALEQSDLKEPVRVASGGTRTGARRSNRLPSVESSSNNPSSSSQKQPQAIPGLSDSRLVKPTGVIVKDIVPNRAVLQQSERQSSLGVTDGGDSVLVTGRGNDNVEPLPTAFWVRGRRTESVRDDTGSWRVDIQNEWEDFHNKTIHAMVTPIAHQQTEHYPPPTDQNLLWDDRRYMVDVLVLVACSLTGTFLIGCSIYLNRHCWHQFKRKHIPKSVESSVNLLPSRNLTRDFPVEKQKMNTKQSSNDNLVYI